MKIVDPAQESPLMRALGAMGIAPLGQGVRQGLGWISGGDGTARIVRVGRAGQVERGPSFRPPSGSAGIAAALHFVAGEDQAGFSAPAGRRLFAADFGVRADGRSDDTDALNRAIAAARGGILSLPAGAISVSSIAIPGGTSIIGQGIGQTTIVQRRGATRPLLVNERPSQGDSEIWLESFAIDGNASLRSRVLHGVLMDRVRNSYFDIECRNAGSHGFLLANGGGNRFGPHMHCHSNGRFAPGYGLYIHNSDANQVHGGRFDDNCIGVAVESSGGGHARRNAISVVTCTANRADFAQSGAGIHFEQSAGNDCDDGLVIDCTCQGSTGVGINNTATNLKISGGVVRNNRLSGITTSGARGFVYQGIELSGNAFASTPGYAAEMRFDDSGMRHASSGDVVDCRMTGTAADGAIKTLSAFSRIDFARNRFAGYRKGYNLAGAGDRIN